MVAELARSWGARIVTPIAKFFRNLGVSPNALTVAGFLLTALVALVLASGSTLLAGILLILTLGFDAVDGALARMTGTATRFGAFLDSTLDRWAEVILFGALIWRYLQAGDDRGVLLAAAAMGASLLVSYTRARAEGIGIPLKEGLLTRFERMVLLIAGLVFGLVIAALWVIAILAAITAVQRIWLTWRLYRTSK